MTTFELGTTDKTNETNLREATQQDLGAVTVEQTVERVSHPELCPDNPAIVLSVN